MKHLKLNSDCITQDSVEEVTRHKARDYPGLRESGDFANNDNLHILVVFVCIAKHSPKV
ncbi:hypothetical protein T4E_4953 [Trichinella pseudospiralis]|uniref:Uncharacterized protein n=1 Tax=Trichinella pseudospiralis TaxID=6337 RepID=A0A0V1FB42_TRIPS|nr:hypothetical protein T4E_4953 [Trichinella pseudospiralis]KRY83341.1 hypothetical protein T4D_17156 [Trichinella pseudospiralis]